MSAYAIPESILPEIEAKSADFICLNFANTDMVGHTGNFDAAVKATEVVDECTKQIVTKALESNYSILILADHGNSDCMINPDGSPNTQHSINLVPFLLIQNENKFEVNDGKLGDVAPTILKLMDVPIPIEMTGSVLVKN